MLSDQGADLVMAEIERLTEDIEIYDYGSATANAILKHLYELHKLRDVELYNDLCECAAASPTSHWSEYSKIWNALAEMQTC